MHPRDEVGLDVGYKVAKILDDKTLVLNVGRAAGVTQGAVFCIYAPVDDVTDPDTGESLGAWEAVKGYVQAIHPQDRLSVCRTFSPHAPRSDRPEDRGTHTLSSELVAVSMLAGRCHRWAKERFGTQALAVRSLSLVIVCGLAKVLSATARY